MFMHLIRLLAISKANILIHKILRREDAVNDFGNWYATMKTKRKGIDRLRNRCTKLTRRHRFSVTKLYVCYSYKYKHQWIANASHMCDVI